MSFNPKRLETGHVHRVRRQDPHAGRRHSEIMSRSGPKASSLVDMSRKELTPDGWRIPIFSGPDFEVSYHYVCARNSTGQVLHESKDRVVRVLAGRLFVNINGNIQQMGSTQSIALGRGVVYEMATSGTEDAELIICQGHDYNKDLKQVSAPGSVNTIAMAAEPHEAPQVVRRPESKAQQQAAQIGAEREAKRKTARTPFQGRAPLPGQQMTGINPRPMGASGFGED